MPTVTEIKNPQAKYCKEKDCLCICLTCDSKIHTNCYPCDQCIPLYISKPNGKSYLAKMPDKLKCNHYKPGNYNEV